MNRKLKSVELFAGCGGMALGFERAGFHPLLLNDFDKAACNSLKANRPEWNVIQGDVSKIDFEQFQGKDVDLLSGGFPCQSFSYAGKQLGLEDTRGTLFYEYARALDIIQPKMFVAENVKGLITHDNGNTLKTIISVFEKMGYKVYSPKVLKAVNYNVPQKRERVFIVGVRSDLKDLIQWDYPTDTTKGDPLTIRDALFAGRLYDCDVPLSVGSTYNEKKKKVLDLVPPGGWWKDLPKDIQKEYMMKSFYSLGGKTGIARRFSWDEPSLTLLCSPAQKQTERCHPDETRPFTIREYARIQTFPDDWIFSGSITNQYKQIGNAVPPNLSEAIGKSIFYALKKHCFS